MTICGLKVYGKVLTGGTSGGPTKGKIYDADSDLKKNLINSYCRNPDNSDTIWCYVDKEKRIWDSCKALV